MKVGVEGIPAPGMSRVAILAPIGEYKVKIKVGDRELAQPVTLLKDPGAGGTEADVRAQGDLVKVLLDDVKQTVEAINRAENVRGQLAALQVRLGEKKDGKGRSTRTSRTRRRRSTRRSWPSRRRCSRCASPAAARTSCACR